MFHALILFSEKINIKKISLKKNGGALLFKMLKWVLDLFFNWNKCFCCYTESKVPLGTGTEFQVPYRFKCEWYPTLTARHVFFLVVQKHMIPTDKRLHEENTTPFTKEPQWPPDLVSRL